MKAAILCEFSGAVRDAFIRAGYDAVSFDLLASETPGPHVQGDIFDQDLTGFDMAIAFPPCTHLAASGARWFHLKRAEQANALAFVRRILALPLPLAMENPVGIISTHVRKPDQIIQPWQHGHPETKATCLWLNGLPPLIPTNIVAGRNNRVHREPPGADRWKRRSRTLPGIAEAMAHQWGGAIARSCDA